MQRKRNISDERARHVLEGFPDAVLHFVRAMESNRRKSAFHAGISEIEIRALFRIAEAGSVTPKQLAMDLAVTTGAITGVADRLFTAGHVQRVAHPGDRRSLFLELTPGGHRVIEEMHSDFVTMLMNAVSDIDTKDLDSVTETLRVVTARTTAIED